MDPEERKARVLFYNVSKKSNVGNIVRSAAAFGVERILVVGQDGAKNAKIKFGSQGTHARMQFEYVPKFTDAIQTCRSEGFKVYGVEIDTDAVPVDEEPFHDGKIVFVFGNEGDGLSQKARDSCDRFVRIKQFAPKTASLNVSVAAGIVLHQWALWSHLKPIEFDEDNHKYHVDTNFNILIGTYTTKWGHCDGQGKGIYKASVNPFTGLLTKLDLVLELGDPSYLLTSAKCNFAVSEKDGALVSFDEKRGQLARIDAGKIPCHIALHNNLVLVAGYGGSACKFLLKDDGILELANEQTHEKGSNAIPSRQASGHPHQFVVLNAEICLCCDLGADEIIPYRMETFERLGSQACSIAGGPRHLAMHPSLPGVGYVVTELSNQLVKFHVEWKEQQLAWKVSEPISVLSPTRDDSKNERVAAGAIVIHPDGKYLFVSNRFHDSVSSFRLDSVSGEATFLANVPCGGRTPRDMVLSESGKLLIVANQDSSNLSVFIVESDGTLNACKQSFPCPTPTCIKLVQ